MGADRKLMEDAIRRLERIERPSTSPGEREAAEWIAAALAELGLQARAETERVHGTFMLPLALLNAIGIVASVVRPRFAGRLLAAAAGALLVDDLDHRSRWFRRRLPARETTNITADAGDAQAERAVVVVAHHDAARGGMVFDTALLAAIKRRFPGFYDRVHRWPPLMWPVALGPMLVALGRRRAGVVLSAGSIAAMADIARSPVAPGANDNLSAVAALLALARRLRDDPVEGLRVILVSTGSEESNSEGMQRWGARHFAGLDRARTDVIALECLGSGTVTVPETEGFLIPHAYDDALKDLVTACAERAGVPIRRGLHVSFASDAQIGLHAGFRSMLLAASDDLKLPANYHKPTDTADNIDYDCLDQAADVLEAAVRALAAQTRPSSERAAATAS